MAITLVNGDSILTTGPNANSTDVPVTIPTGAHAPAAGDWILHFIVTGSGTDYASFPAGWTVLDQGSIQGVAYGALIGREWQSGDADGVAVANGATQYSIVTQVWRPSSGKRLHIEGFFTAGTSTNANPPDFSPTGGTQDYMAVAVAMLDGSSGGTITGAPSTYSTVEVAGRSSSVGGVVGAAYKQLTGVTHEDPAAFASSNEQWGAATVMIWEYSAGYSLSCAAGSFGVSGQPAALKAARKVAADAGSFALGGQAAALRKGVTLAAGQGSYALGGQAATLRPARRIAAGQGSYAVAGQAAALSYSGAAPATLPSTPAVRYHPTFSNVTTGGDGRVTAIEDMMGLADASASAGDGPLTGSDAAGAYWRFQASQWLTIATALGLNSRDFSVFAVCKPIGYGNNGVLSIGVNGASPPNVGGAIARIAQGGTGYATKPLVASKQAFSEKILVGEQLQVIGWSGRSTGIYTTVNGYGNGAGSAPTSGTAAGAEIGRNANSPSGTYFYGDIFELAIFDSALDDSAHDAVAAALCNHYGIPLALTKTLAADGDSIMQGQGIDAFAGMMSQLVDADSPYYQPLDTRVINVGLGGSGWTKAAQLNPTTRRDTAESVYADDRQLTGDRTLFLMCGRNDVDDTSASADAIYDDYVAHLNTTTTGLLQRGWKVVVGVNISGGAGIDGGINQLRALLRDPQFLVDCDAGPGGTYDGMVVIKDLPSITYSSFGTVFDSNTDSTDAAIYQDGTHPTTLGNLLMGTGGDTPQYGFFSALAASYSMAANYGSYAMSGQAAALKVAHRLPAASGSFALAGQAAALKRSIGVAAAQGSYALTGQIVLLKRALRLPAGQGSYILSGQTVSFSSGKQMQAAHGAFVLSGQDAALRRAIRMAAVQGSYSLSGQVASLRAARKLAAAQGAYSLSGQVALLRVARKIIAGQGAYSVNGQDVSFSAGKRMQAAHGAFALSGQDAALRRAIRMAAASGNYVLAGQMAALLAARRIMAAPGNYTLGGQTAALRRTVRMTAGPGHYAVAGQDVTMTIAGVALRPLPIRSQRFRAPLTGSFRAP